MTRACSFDQGSFRCFSVTSCDRCGLLQNVTCISNQERFYETQHFPSAVDYLSSRQRYSLVRFSLHPHQAGSGLTLLWFLSGSKHIWFRGATPIERTGVLVIPQGKHTNGVSVCMLEMQRNVWEHWRSSYRKLISDNVYVKAQNKRTPTLVVVYCSLCGSKWRILAICFWVLRWLILNNYWMRSEHDIMNYQNRGLCYLPKPKAEADNTDKRFW